MTNPLTKPARYWPNLAPRVLVVVTSCGSVALLLGHLYDVASMARLASTIGVGSVLVGAAAVIYAYPRDAEFRDAFLAGLIGGLLGTVGYDMVRMPLHYWGFNPFPPIRGYGVWLAGASNSSPWTDGIGFVYHLSNGITFGWMYSFVALRRHRGWAIGWALVLETLAVFTAFGVVFGLRTAYGTLAVAYLAHLAYGWPLGWLCERPERLQRFLPLHRRAMGGVLVWLMVVMATWFVTAWQPFDCAPVAGVIEVGPDALCPGWTDVPVGTTLRLENRTGQPITLRYRAPDALQTLGVEMTIAAGGIRSFDVALPGIHQILAPDTGWRSVLISAQEGGDYRLR